MKCYLVCLLLFLVISQELPEQQRITVETKLEVDQSDDYDGNKIKNKEKMKNLVNIYIKDQNWNEEQQIDKETFIKMFIDVIQKSSLKQRTTRLLNRFAENTIDKYGEPILVKNLQNYFNLDALERIYLQLFNPHINTDL